MIREDEIWKPCIGFENEYMISNYGRVKSIYWDKIRKPRVNNKGYYFLSFRKNGKGIAKSIHKLTIITFKGYKKGKTHVIHKNRIRTDNKISNLEWATRSEIMQDSVKSGRQTFEFIRKKINQYSIEGKFIKTHSSQTQAAIDFNIDSATIRGVLSGDGILAAGYMWRFFDGNTDDISPARTKRLRSKKVSQFSLDGSLISEYESLTEAEKITGVPHQTIAKCCVGKQKTSYGFIWKHS